MKKEEVEKIIKDAQQEIIDDLYGHAKLMEQIGTYMSSSDIWNYGNALGLDGYEE